MDRRSDDEVLMSREQRDMRILMRGSPLVQRVTTSREEREKIWERTSSAKPFSVVIVSRDD